MEYLVTGNIQHDGKSFVAGDAIELSDAQAAPLLKVGVIEDPRAEPEIPENPARRPEKKAKTNTDVPTVGGAKSQTGEPSIDGQENKIDTAKDITPPTDLPPGAQDISADL